MGDDAFLSGPEPSHDQVVVLCGRKIDDAVDAAHDGYNPACAEVLPEKLPRVPRRPRLCGREVPLLGGGNRVDVAPLGSCGRCLASGHAAQM